MTASAPQPDRHPVQDGATLRPRSPTPRAGQLILSFGPGVRGSPTTCATGSGRPRAKSPRRRTQPPTPAEPARTSLEVEASEREKARIGKKAGKIRTRNHGKASRDASGRRIRYTWEGREAEKKRERQGSRSRNRTMTQEGCRLPGNWPRCRELGPTSSCDFRPITTCFVQFVAHGADGMRAETSNANLSPGPAERAQAAELVSADGPSPPTPEAVHGRHRIGAPQLLHRLPCPRGSGTDSNRQSRP